MALTAILAVALVLRLAWITIADPQPNSIASGDPFFYDVFARFLAAGEGFVRIGGQATAQWPPGYPAVLAVVFKVFGHKIILAKLLNVLLGTATCLLAYLIGKKVFNRAAGLTAAARARGLPEPGLPADAAHERGAGDVPRRAVRVPGGVLRAGLADVAAGAGRGRVHRRDLVRAGRDDLPGGAARRRMGGGAAGRG